MTKTKNNKTIILVATLLLVAAVAMFLYVRSKQQNNTANPNNEPDISSINYSPPSEVDKAETDQNKANLDKRLQNENQSPGSEGVRMVTPVVTFANYNEPTATVETGSFIPSVYEEGGNCTLYLKKDGTEVTQQQGAARDAKTTVCGIMRVNRDRLSPGTWEVSVGYESATAKGISAITSVQVK